MSSVEKAVTHPALQTCLGKLEREFPWEYYRDVIGVDTIPLPLIHKVFGFNRKDHFNNFAEGVFKSNLVKRVWKIKMVLFDPDGLRAFAAICGTHRIMYSDDYQVDHHDDERLVRVAVSAKKLLGDHPLAAKINVPVLAEVRPPELTALPLVRVSRKETSLKERYEKKAPMLDIVQLEYLSTLDREALAALTNTIPRDLDTVSLKDGPMHLVQAIMFIDNVNRHTISQFDPNENEYPRMVFLGAVNVALAYMKRHPKICNLLVLFEAVKKDYLKNHEKYFASSRLHPPGGLA